MPISLHVDVEAHMPAGKPAMSARHRSLCHDPGHSGLDPVVWYGPSDL